MPKLVWRVKLVAELEPGVATETEVARIERGEAAGLADLGLRLEKVAWFRIGRFWVTRAHEERRPVRAGFRQAIALLHGSMGWAH